MKKLMPMLSAGAMMLSVAAPVFAAEENTPTEEVKDDTTAKGDGTVDDTTGKGEDTAGDGTNTGDDTTGGDTTGGEGEGNGEGETTLAEQAADVLAKLEAIDTKAMSEEQIAAIEEAKEALGAAIASGDEKELNAAIEVGMEIVNAVNTPADPTVEEASAELLASAQDMLDRASVALKLNGEKWTKEQSENITALCSLLQTAVTNKDKAAIEENMEKVNAAFMELGVDLSKITEEDVNNAKGTSNSQSSTGVESMVGVIATGLGTAAVAVGGLTYKIRKRD